jgi:hypothetical protein
LTHPDARTRSALLAAIALSTALSTGCTRSGVDSAGDMPVTVTPSEYGNGQHISSLLGGFTGPAPWVQPANVNSISCPYPPAASSPYVPIVTTGVTVTAVDTYDETGDGAVGSVYVQDTVLDMPTPPYGASSLFEPSFTPPDLRPLPGDVVDIIGEYEEFIGPSSGTFPECETLPQLSGAATLRFSGAVPAPVVITPEDLSSYENARPYFNMLVTVTNVTVGGANTPSSGRYTYYVDNATWSIANELFPLQEQMPISTAQTFKSVTGIVTYFYDVELAPRSPADFEM